jgi:O-antigen ligase
MAGITASFLSGSRGGWLGVPVILLFIFFHVRTSISPGQIKVTVASLLVGIILAVAIPATGIKDRLYSAHKDLQGYFYKDKKTSSLGARLEMWKSAYFIFLEAPVAGVGKSKIRGYEKALIKDDDVHKVVKKYAHAHSDYLDSLSERGILGLALLLLFYFGNLKIFNDRVITSSQPVTKALALMGAVGALSYINFSFTESLLTKNMGLSFYCFTLIIIWAVMDRFYQQEKEARFPGSQESEK